MKPESVNQITVMAAIGAVMYIVFKLLIEGAL